MSVYRLPDDSKDLNDSFFWNYQNVNIYFPCKHQKVNLKLYATIEYSIEGVLGDSQEGNNQIHCSYE